MASQTDIAGGARVLYGPAADRPSPQQAGDRALFVSPEDGQALYQVQMGNWARVAAGGVPVLHGPYVVEYTDIPHEDNTKVIWTPVVGDVLLALCVDFATVTQWDYGTLFIHHAPGTWDPDTAPSLIARASAGDIAAQGSDDLTMQQGAASWLTNATGGAVSGGAIVFASTDPVRIQLHGTGGHDPTHGHVEMYALVARAVAP